MRPPPPLPSQLHHTSPVPDRQAGLAVAANGQNAQWLGGGGCSACGERVMAAMADAPTFSAFTTRAPLRPAPDRSGAARALTGAPLRRAFPRRVPVNVLCIAAVLAMLCVNYV